MVWVGGLLVIIAALVFVHGSLAARERVVEVARAACLSVHVQFLDDTVAGTGVEVTRRGDGRICLRRHFRFEFSAGGVDRRAGSVSIVNRRIEFLRLELESGPLLLDPDRLTPQPLH